MSAPNSTNLTPFRNFQPEPIAVAEASDRLQLSSEFLYPILLEQQDILDQIRQVNLRRESEFISWGRKLGIDAWAGYPIGDCEMLWRKGWLRADGACLRHRGHKHWQEPYRKVETLNIPLTQSHRASGRWLSYELEFHPFRLFPLMKVLEMMDWRLTRTSVLYGEGVINYASNHVKQFRSWLKDPRFVELLNWWNGIADLAILLEPIYWSRITGITHGRSVIQAQGNTESEEASILRSYRDNVLDIVRKIPKAIIAKSHMDLRIEAAQNDNNHELYLLLRSSNWHKREQVEGRIGCAMWIRHMAEVLRHAYDEVYADRLVHEDEAFGWWQEGARSRVYGSEYPLDNQRDMVRRILPRWGIASSPRVRFYVEGETEEAALEEGLWSDLGYGLEVVNLRAQGWGSWLKQELENDVAAKRISLLMLDDDQVPGYSDKETRKRQDAIRAVKQRVREGLVVGMIFKNSPDLEMGCFTIEELIQATELVEQERGISGLEPLLPDHFSNIHTGREFAERYSDIRKALSLKGETWGKTLMRVAFISGRGEQNKLVHAWACAIRSVKCDYESHRARCSIDSESLECRIISE